MRHYRMYFLLLVSCLFIICCPYSKTLAKDNIAVLVLDHSVKPVDTVSSGRFLEIVWEVKLCNKEEEPVNLIITILFMDKNEDTLEKAEKKCAIKANETRIYSDTLLLRTSIAEEVASTSIDVQVE